MIQNSLKEKLNRFNPSRPYVWELKVTEDEFRSLETDLCRYTPDASKKDDALKILVYVSEWYKRRYTNRAKKDYQKTFGGKKPDLETVWKTLGVDKKFLYEGEGGQKLYLYSTFVLGGLAITFELQKNEKPFLKSLCRILNGEDDSFENIVDASHSIAFRESVKQHHCLYVYLDMIVRHYNHPEELPFAIEDYKLSDTKIKELVDLIKTINDSVKKSKFRLEWIVNAPSGDNLITRSLHLWLNPNMNDASKRHVYSNEDIQGMWGVPQPENQHYIRIGLRFIKQTGKEEIVVQEANKKKPAITFRNTGDVKIGFIASEADYAIVKRIPVHEFNVVEIVCWDDDDNCYSIVKEDANFDAMPLYRMEQFEDFWTNRSLPKRESVVLFSDKYTISECSDDKDFVRKTLYNKYYGDGISVNWCPVNIAVILQGADGKLLDPFVNRQGTNKIFIHQYKETIKYTLDGKVEWHQKDIEDETETTDFVSFVGKKDDILAYFSQKQDEGEEDKIEVVRPDSIQFKGENGRYIEWDDSNMPSTGINYIKVYARHKLINTNDKPFPIFYLPGGVIRDCVEHTIKNNDILLLDDSENIKKCIDRRQILSPTICITISSGETDTIVVPVYRPAKLKEVCYDGQMINAVIADSVVIPYILKNNIVVNLYGEFGYATYDCRNLGSIYPLLGDLSNAHLNSWEHTEKRNATLLDPYAPGCLYVKFGDKFDEHSHRRLEFYYWNYSADTEPQKVRYGTKQEKNTIIFQSLNRVNAQLANVYPTIINSPFGKKVQADLLKCFEVATFHRIHYFAMKPLLAMENDKRLFVSKIYEPLLSKRNGKLTLEDINGLKQLADEFKFDWHDYDIDINNLIYNI